MYELIVVLVNYRSVHCLLDNELHHHVCEMIDDDREVENEESYVVGTGMRAEMSRLPKISWKFCLQPRSNPSFCGPLANIGARKDSKVVRFFPVKNR